MAPDGWRSANLDSLARVNPEQLRNQTDPEHLLEYLDIAAIERPGVIGATRTLRFSEAPSRARRLARNGDILVSTIRPYLRNFARIREAPDNLVVSTGYAVIRPGSGVDGRFLYQHILSAGFIDFLKPRMSGSNYPAVTASDVEAYPLSLPPLPEQRKIAAILSSVDDAIEKTQAIIDQVQVVKRGLMQELLTRGLPGRHTPVQADRDREEIGRDEPDGWRPAYLGDLARVNPEQLGSRTDPDHLLEYLDITAIERPGVFGSSRTFRFSEAPSRARRLAREGDILVSTVRPYLRNFARVREAPDNLVVSTGYAVIRPEDGVDGGFLYQHVLSARFVEFLKPRMSGSNYPAVTADDVEAYPLLLPPLPEQRKIAATLSSVDDTIEENQTIMDRLRVLKTALMSTLLTGELRVTPAPEAA